MTWITIREAFDAGIWERLCEVKGWNPWIVNEGRASMDEGVDLDDDEVRALILGTTPRRPRPAFRPIYGPGESSEDNSGQATP